MAYSRIKKILFVLLCLFVVLFPFWCVRGLCAENVTFDVVSNLTISGSNNYFSTNSSDSAQVLYFECDRNFKYTITNNSISTTLKIGYCDAIPANNVVVERIVNLEAGDSVSIIPTGGHIYIASTVGSNTGVVTVVKEELEGMNSAINDLVSDVGIQSLWNTFNSANPFILVVVLFSFGLFIIIALVRKLKKGKGGF